MYLIDHESQQGSHHRGGGSFDGAFALSLACHIPPERHHCAMLCVWDVSKEMMQPRIKKPNELLGNRDERASPSNM
jgi:hypothetical protein